MNRKNTGQVIVVVMIALVVLTIIIPAIITYIDREAHWSVKEERSTHAFQLAEAGIERGYQTLLLSTATLASAEAGNPVPNYNFDLKYTDLPGGQYEIRIVGNPAALTLTITSVGMDSTQNELRAIQVVYATPGAYPAAVYAINSATIQGNPFVEWGPVASPGPIVTDAAHTHPRYYSSGQITPFDTTWPNPPHSDNVQWWDDYSLPPVPQIDLPGYKAIAAACVPSGVDNTNCVSSTCKVCYYTASSYSTYDPGTNNFFNQGPGTALIVEGNLNLHGHYGNGTVVMQPPSKAWKEYGQTVGTNEWTTDYVPNYDPTCPYASYAAAQAANYSPASLPNFTINDVLIRGFLYVGGSITISGGGNATIVGSMFVATVANLGSSHVTVYYDNAVISQIKTQNTQLARTSWQEVTNCSWTGANATCP